MASNRDNDDVKVQNLFEACSKRVWDHRLDLLGFHIGDKQAKRLPGVAALMGGRGVEELDLRGNSLHAEGAICVADAVKIFAGLLKVQLGHNPLGDGGAMHIAKVLTTCSSLRELKLNYAQIGDEGVGHLADGLRDNRTLLRLNNAFGAEGARHLADALKSNQCLEWLSLSRNRIGDVGALYLGDALKVNTSLRELNVGGDARISSRGARHLLEAVVSGRRLIYVGVNGTASLFTMRYDLLYESILINMSTTLVKNEKLKFWTFGSVMQPMVAISDVFESRLSKFSVARVLGASVMKFREEVIDMSAKRDSLRTEWLPRTFRRTSFLTALGCVRRMLIVAVHHHIVDAYLLATMAQQLWWREHPFFERERSMEECYRALELKEMEEKGEEAGEKVVVDDRWMLKWADFVRVVQWCLAQSEEEKKSEEVRRVRRVRVKSGVKKEEYLREMEMHLIT